MGFIARREAVTHRLQVDAFPIMRTSNHEGLINLSAKGVPLELAHLGRDLNGTSRERAGPLQPHHLKVIVDHSEGSA